MLSLKLGMFQARDGRFLARVRAISFRLFPGRDGAHRAESRPRSRRCAARTRADHAARRSGGAHGGQPGAAGLDAGERRASPDDQRPVAGIRLSSDATVSVRNSPNVQISPGKAG